MKQGRLHLPPVQCSGKCFASNSLPGRLTLILQRGLPLPTLPKATLTPALHTEKGPGLGGPWAWLTEAAAQYLLRDQGEARWLRHPSARGAHITATHPPTPHVLLGREKLPNSTKGSVEQKGGQEQKYEDVCQAFSLFAQEKNVEGSVGQAVA